MKKNVNASILYFFLIFFGIIMIYPLLWMFFSAFKSNSEIMSSAALLPQEVVWGSFREGFKGSGQYTFGTFLMNSFKLTIPTVIFTVMSSAIVSYGFARFDFPFKKILFAVMLSMLMLPNTVLIIPRYLLFNQIGWLNSYLPFIVPAMFGCYPFFIFMLVQFFRGIPRELDESATIDGCGSFKIFTSIILPLSGPALISAALFQFIWIWNDFFNVLIYINSVEKFPIALGLKMTIDTAAQTNWNQILAMSTLAILPPVIIFLFSQKYFVEGISTTGLKG